jgi:hypothetical protein
MVPGGQRRTIEVPGEPVSTTLCERASPEVLVSDAGARAVDRDRWPGQVRPYPRNRRHVLDHRHGA